MDKRGPVSSVRQQCLTPNTRIQGVPVRIDEWDTKYIAYFIDDITSTNHTEVVIENANAYT